MYTRIYNGEKIASSISGPWKTRQLQAKSTPFPIWNQSIVLCLVLTVASWPTYKFLRRQVRWSGSSISLRIFHSLLWSTQKSHLESSEKNFQIYKLDLEKAEEPEIKLPTSAGSQKKQESSTKHLFLLYWLRQILWLCGSPQTMENSSRHGNTRPSNLPPEKLVCGSRSNS